MARTTANEFVFFEVKASASGNLGGALSIEQRNAERFVMDRLETAINEYKLEESTKEFAMAARAYAYERIDSGKSLNTKIISFNRRNNIVVSSQW